MFLFSLLTSHLNNLSEMISRHKNLVIAHDEKHASRELLSFKFSICKENVEHLQNESVKETLSANNFF